MSKDDPASQIDKTLKKYKKRMKCILCCGVVWILLAVISLIVGIVLLVYFVEYWGVKEQWKSGLAYFGAVLMIVFIVSFVIGVVLFIILRLIYKKMENPETGMKMFKPQSYAYGEAPYPQQPPETAPSPTATQPLQPGGAQPSAPPAGMQDVTIEVDEHQKF